MVCRWEEDGQSMGISPVTSVSKRLYDRLCFFDGYLQVRASFDVTKSRPVQLLPCATSAITGSTRNNMVCSFDTDY